MRFSCSILLLSMLTQPLDPSSLSEPSPPSLKTQLETYFRIPKAGDRAKAIADIAQSYRFQEAAAELPRLELFSKQASSGEWKITLPSGLSIQAAYTLPLENNPTGNLPLIIVFPMSGESAPTALARSILQTTSVGLNHAWVAFDSLVGGSFHQSIPAAGDLPALLHELRRRIHIDVDRIYLLGDGAGADAVWMAATMHPNHFAGVIAISGFPRIPYPEQSYALLLPNLRGTPFLSIWTDDPTAQGASPVPAVNKAVADFALAAGLPFESAVLAQIQPGMPLLPQRDIAEMLANKRQPKASVQLWFRYLPQGNAGWLRATDLADDVWNDEKISIAVTASADRDEFITETIKQKLFYISGRIDGQTITVDTKRVAAVELRLSPEQVDFSKPVTIVINGRNRFEGVLEPSIKDLLESAYEDWDFQHPVYLRKSFSINATP